VTGVGELFVRVAGTNPVVQGLAGDIVIALLDRLGAVLVLVWRDPSERALDGAVSVASQSVGAGAPSPVSTTLSVQVPRRSHAVAASVPSVLPAAIPHQMPVAPSPNTRPA